MFPTLKTTWKMNLEDWGGCWLEVQRPGRMPMHQCKGKLVGVWAKMVSEWVKVARLCPTLWDPMNRSTPGLPAHHQLPEFTHTLVHWVGDAIQPSHPQSSPSSLAFNFSQHQDFFPMNQLFTSGGQSIGASASTSVLSMNIQDWLPLGWTGWISL